MECQDVKRLMHSLLDDELDPHTHNQIEGHIAVCPECRHHYKELGQVVHKLSTAEWHKAPAQFTENLISIMQRQHLQRHSWRVPFVRWVGIGAAAVFVFSLGVWWALPNHFSVTANPSSGLIVSGKQVIVPKGQEHDGDLIIHNGDVVVEGKVKGDIVTLNGQIYKQAGADISGKTQEINETFEILGYYLDKIWLTIKNSLK